jgi:hypothetical protein
MAKSPAGALSASYKAQLGCSAIFGGVVVSSTGEQGELCEIVQQ